MATELTPINLRGHFIDVIYVLVFRDFKCQYKNTILGLVWSFITPLFFLLTFYFVFKVILNIGIPKYASFVFTGIVVWAWFQASLTQAAVSISSNPNLVSQPGFPTAALPAVPIVSNLINFGISLPLLLAILAVEGTRPAASLATLPFLMIGQIMLMLSLNYLIAALNVTFRDLQYILPIILQLGYFMSPIFYDMSQISERYRLLFAMNPIAQLITDYRTVLMHGGQPDWTGLAAIVAGSCVVLAASYSYFRHASQRFLEEL